MPALSERSGVPEAVARRQRRRGTAPRTPPRTPAQRRLIETRGQAVRRHTRQREELHRLMLEIIPVLQRRRAALSRPDPLSISLTGPTELDRKRTLTRTEERLAAADQRADKLASLIRTRRGRRAPQITPLEAGAAILGVFPPVRAAQGVGLLGRAALSALGRGAAEEGGQVAVRAAAATSAKTAATRAAEERAAQAATSTASRAAGGRLADSPVIRSLARALDSRAGRAARVGGRAASTPLRVGYRNKGRIFGGAVASPLAVGSGLSLQQGSIDPLVAELEGRGVVARGLGAVGNVIAAAAPGEIADNLIRDLFDLPAQALPSVYLPLHALVEKAQGNGAELDALLSDYAEHGLLPGIAKGDLAQIGEAIKTHPLFSALEARGGAAVVGRSAGALGRAAGVEAASTKRAPLELGGGLAPVERRYSPDVIERAVQALADRRRQQRRGGQVASRRERTRALAERTDRVVSEDELVRRAHREAETREAGTKPKSDAEADAVALAAQGIVRSPKTFRDDLANYRRALDAEYRAGGLSRSERIANRSLDAQIRRAEKAADPESVFRAAREYALGQRGAEGELIKSGLLDAEQARKAAAIPFAVVHMGATHGKPKAGGAAQLLDRAGNPLGIDRIEAEMRRQGVDPESIAFLSQRPSARGAGSYFRAFWPERATLAKAQRRGTATRRGTFDASFEALVEQRVRTRTIADAAKSFDRAIREFAIGRRRFASFSQAQRAARDPEDFGLDIPADFELVAVRIAPYSAAHKELQSAERLFDELDPADQTEIVGKVGDLLEEAQRPGAGPVVLLPRVVVNRLGEHFTRAGVGRRGMQVITQAFKGVVLPFSPRWLTGNLLDVSMRSLFAGLGAGDYFLGRKLLAELKRIDPEAAERLEASALSGAHFGSAEQTRIHRDARQFADTRLAPLAATLGTLRRTPGIKQAVSAYARLRDAIFAFNERFIERQPQYAALGKEARRDVQATTGRWHHALMLGDDAIADLAKGLLGTAKQIQYAKAVEEVFGQWKANSPTARAFLVDYSPFGMWTRAATKYVLWTLPAKHPIKTALFAAATEMTDDERAALGLSHFVPGRLPPYLQGSLPTPSGGVIPIQAFTSFGVFADYPSSISNAILPQFSGILEGLAGLDWSGRQLTNADGTPLDVADRVRVAMYSQAEAFVPFLAMTRRALERGGSSAPGSTVFDPRTTAETGDLLDGLAKVFLPVSVYAPEKVGFLRSLSQSRQIEVPAKPSSSGTAPWSSSDSGLPWSTDGSSSSLPWSTGASGNPWLKPSASAAPWRR